MEKLLKGVLRYNAAGKSKFVEEIKRLGDSLKPTTVMVSCMDSRVFPSRFADVETAEMFIMRNAGNMVPHYRHYAEGNMIGTEGAGFQLGVVLNNIKNLVVCGHSDCKAVNTLYELRQDCDYSKHKDNSPLKTWITLHGQKSIETMYNTAPDGFGDSNDVYKPLVCSFNIRNKSVTAKIDPGNKFNMQDKLSQLHCLQQASHFSSYPFLQERMEEGKLDVHAMWFDIHKGDVYLFSPSLERFAVIDDANVDRLMEDINS